MWVHMICGEFFVMERDTVTHKVLSSAALDGEHAA
ncbi:sarcosine oxidase subunit delta [Mesorhizobium sp. M7A.F.Ca.CA.002.05.1.1]|nr:sarcosine oxidase subunit delta [Mesorhizobium sp. M7A.F.Ca.CA.002.05.1.1]